MAEEQLSGVIGNLVTNGNQTNQLLGKLIEVLSNAQGIDISGGIVSSGATAGIGYTTGAGGTITQASSKSTTVVIDNATGQITMNGAALNAGIEVSFTVTNSAIAAADVVVVNHSSAGTAGAYAVMAHSIAAGSFAITVSNWTAGNLSEAIVLSFAIIKGATA